MSYFFIKSRFSGFVLDISGGEAVPGNSVIVYSKHEEKDNQKWRFDVETGTVRSKLNDNIVLDVINDSLVVNNYEEGKADQQWHIVNGVKFLNIADPQYCIDITDSDEAEGAKVIKFPYYGTQNQFWDIEAALPPRKEFYIINQQSPVVATVKGGTDIVSAQRDPNAPKSQRFYLDDKGFIRSAENDLAFTAKTGENIQLTDAADDDHSSQWRFNGIFLQSKAGQVLDFVNEEVGPGVALCASEPTFLKNQAWSPLPI